VLGAAGSTPRWETFAAGAEAVEKHGTTLPPELLESIKKNKVALKGPIATPVGKGFTSVNVGLRKALELYANLRPVWNLPSVKSRYRGVDLVIVRENTEDLYAGLEHVVVPGVVESLKIITEAASTRIAVFASRICVQVWSADSAWCPPQIPVRAELGCSKPCTERRPTSRARYGQPFCAAAFGGVDAAASR